MGPTGRATRLAAKGQGANVTVGRLISWELAAAVAAAALGRSWPVLAGGLALAALIVAISFLRRRWFFQCRLFFWGSRHDLSRVDDRASGLLAAMLPGATTVTVQTGHGPVLALSHPNGLTAIVREPMKGPGPFSIRAVAQLDLRADGAPTQPRVPRSCERAPRAFAESREGLASAIGCVAARTSAERTTSAAPLHSPD